MTSPDLDLCPKNLKLGMTWALGKGNTWQKFQNSTSGFFFLEISGISGGKVILPESIESIFKGWPKHQASIWRQSGTFICYRSCGIAIPAKKSFSALISKVTLPWQPTSDTSELWRTYTTYVSDVKIKAKLRPVSRGQETFLGAVTYIQTGRLYRAFQAR